jgi:ATP-dependent protease ClpP protease subunit
MDTEDSELRQTHKLNFVDGDNVFIYGEFDKSFPECVISPLIKLVESKKQLKNGTINIYIDSNGGYARMVWNVVSILEEAKKSGVTIKTYVFGSAYSCGSILAIVGSENERYISRNAEHVVHLGATGTRVQTNLQLEREVGAMKKHFERVVAHYKKYCNIPNIEDALKDDSFFIFDKDIIRNKMADKFIGDEPSEILPIKTKKNVTKINKS